ncbi:HD-GYP domain-containing protein [Thermosediminibacter litoriperuensis]|uniref:Putative nucleotidyltransferase with HDIG domain n=1 Tax=Thermosediminibacter litoriperuensis TaxID=291989 RepID=A0A5S5AWT5_9FIRM|nr:HD-GYP domain-containing protein [Thermosediminibacter litoriperuensis]TYP57825.1 putative nucleotidyltransferase with HDIG domain [Thermosediminibacter litoriperuensis]
MIKLNKQNLYFLIILLIATLFLIYSYKSLLAADIKTFIIFTILALLAETLSVRLVNDAEVTVGFAVFIGSILVLGYEVSIWVAFMSELLCEIRHRIPYHTFFKKITNIGLYIVMVGGSGLIYERLGGVPGYINLQQNLFGFLALILTYFLINVGLLTIGLSILYKKSIKYIFSTTFKWALPNYIALAPLGILLAIIYINIGALGLLLFLIPLLVARHSFKLYMEMKKVYLETIQALATAIEAKDPYTRGHSERVARLAVAIAEELKMDSDFISNLQYAALLHDIGKIGIPEEILNKPCKLSEDEFSKIKTHPALGASIVKNVDFLAQASSFIMYHHERMDGSGYPVGLKGEEIPLGAEIIAVADVFDALTTDRPYRKAWRLEDALDELERSSGVQFRPAVIKALKKVLEREKIWKDAVN